MNGIGADAAPLTASEVVVLFGDQFVPEAGMLGYREAVLTSGIKVSTDRLAMVMLRAALLTLHDAGALTLRIERRKALLGLVTRQVLTVGRGVATAAVPEETLEAELVAAIRGAAHDVAEVIEEVIGGEVDDPSGVLIARVKRGLAHRGLLETSERTTLKVFTTVTYVVPEATLQRVDVGAVERVRGELEAAERERQDVWSALEKSIRRAIVSRTSNRD